MDIKKTTDLGVDVRGSIFIFCSIIYLFEKQNGACCCSPSKDGLIIHYLCSKYGFTYGHFIRYKMLLFRLHVYRSINPLPHMAILGSTNSAVNRDLMSKI